MKIKQLFFGKQCRKRRSCTHSLFGCRPSWAESFSARWNASVVPGYTLASEPAERVWKHWLALRNGSAPSMFSPFPQLLFSLLCPALSHSCQQVPHIRCSNNLWSFGANRSRTVCNPWMQCCFLTYLLVWTKLLTVKACGNANRSDGTLHGTQRL